ncbi:MAG: response regulator transcription factor [Bacteroidales bacterium]|nr:response regulator transcription factor [Lachnoclostridium sp.]MCM1384410.1 response regulator transcription factor [Lachnoclostridium sp.]MCM1465190.1 response regulator transcription factor [Bacteroidales bacterium]
MMKIFIVEDDEALLKEIAGYLNKWGYETLQAENFADIAGEALSLNPDLILMDVNLPNFDGFYWCAQIRQISTVPVIFISSRNDDKDKIMGVAWGGDDYVDKPFRLELLKAKIEALLRRTYHYREKKEIYLWGELHFDCTSQIMFVGDKEVELTKSERKILSKLMAQRPGIVTREELMQELWSTDEFISDGTLTTLISRLRAKLKDAAGEEIICTKKGVGYSIP